MLLTSSASETKSVELIVVFLKKAIIHALQLSGLNLENFLSPSFLLIHIFFKWELLLNFFFTSPYAQEKSKPLKTFHGSQVCFCKPWDSEQIKVDPKV